MVVTWLKRARKEHVQLQRAQSVRLKVRISYERPVVVL